MPPMSGGSAGRGTTSSNHAPSPLGVSPTHRSSDGSGGERAGEEPAYDVGAAGRAAQPRVVESGAVLVYLALYAVFFLVFGLNWAHAVLPAGQSQDLLIMGMKLVVHIVGPLLLLMALGTRIAPLFAPRPTRQRADRNAQPVDRIPGARPACQAA